MGVLYDTGCDRFCCGFACKRVGLKFLLHFKHCLNEPSCIRGVVVLLLQNMQSGEYVERT